MCGRVIVKTSVSELLATFSFAKRAEDDGLDDFAPRYNGAPGLEYPLIVREPDMPGTRFMSARWGLIPRWMKDTKGGPRPINAKSETVAEKPMFRAAYKTRRALMPIDGFFEWKAIKGAKAKQPFAIAMKSGEPFCLAAIWERWREPETGVEFKTFAILTCGPNEMMAEIHDRMPVIIGPEDYTRWLSDIEPDPHDLLKPYPAELMTMWPVSRRVNRPANDEPSILDPVPVPDDLFDDD